MKTGFNKIAVRVIAAGFMVMTFSAAAQNVLMSGWNNLSVGSMNQMTAFITSQGYTVTQSDTFPASLDGYDILILMGGGSDKNNIPDSTVDNFVYMGHSLILFENIINSGNFNVTALSNPVQSTSGWIVRDTAVVTDAGHPLCTGVAAICHFTGYSTVPVIKPGANVAMIWQDQTVFAASYSHGSGRIVYFNHLQAWYNSYWASDATDGEKLMANAMAWVQETGVGGDVSEGSALEDFTLFQNYPNPFNPSTKIHYSLQKPCLVSLKIYDLLGKEMDTLINEHKQPGEYNIEWTAKDLPSGIYLYRLQAGDYVETKKMVLQQ